MEAISLRTALDEIRKCKRHNDLTCTVEFLQFDARRSSQKGSEIKTLENVFIARGNHDEISNGLIHVASKSHPRPWPIHVHLIMKVNGKPVYG